MILWFLSTFLNAIHFNFICFFPQPIISLIFLYAIFLKVNVTKIEVKKNIVTPTILKTTTNDTIVNIYKIFGIYCILVLWVLHGKVNNICYNHFLFNNFCFCNLQMFVFVSFSTYFFLKVVDRFNNLSKSTDFNLSVINLFLILPYLFFVNTLFTFLFFLELTSVTLFYKLTSSNV